MFSRPCQDRRSLDRGWVFHAVLLLAGFGSTAAASSLDDGGDMPLPLAESLREAGIVANPAAEPVKPKAIAAPATPPVALPMPAPAAAPAPAPLPTPVAAQAPRVPSAAPSPAAPAEAELPLLPVAADPTPVAAPGASPAPAPAADPAPVAAVPAQAEATPAPAPTAAPSSDADLDLPPLPSDAPVSTPVPAAEPAAAAPPTPAASLPISPSQMFAAPVDSSVAQAACPSCGHRLHSDGHGGYSGCNSCGRSGQCVPGQKGCAGMSGCQEHYMCRMIGNLYECLCCPDPCYQPSWVPEANAAFFQDYARPRSLTRFRWDHGWRMQYPDRNEFFWARQSTSKGGAGPKFPPAGYNKGRNPVYGQTGVNYDQLYFYTEAANPLGSLFFEMPYRSNNPVFGPSMSGFADLNFGSKSLLFDTELLQLTFQFKSFMPTGQASKGLGVAHVSLEPSLLFSMRLAPETYLQGQFAEWIPLGGDPTYAGALMHYHLSYNQVLWRPMADTPVIGTLEFNGWSFQDGSYTDPYINAPQSSSGTSYLTLGPGLRTSVCDKIDFGGALAFPVSNHWWASPLLRLELRILY